VTKSEAAAFPWEIAAPIVGFLGFVAVILLGLALLREITR
jgi:uncharacterized membrane protein